MTKSRINETVERLNLTPQQAAIYLGVPIGTLRKWQAGTRHPPAAVTRLLYVLGAVETLAPDIHNHLLEN